MAVIPKNTLKSKFQTGDRPTGADFEDLIDTTSFNAESLGADGNNEQTITGLESETIVDRVNISEWRSLKYTIALSAVEAGQNKFYSTNFDVLIDQNTTNISEYGTLDNDGDIGTVVVSQMAGEIRLIVTPDIDLKPVTVRYSRTGLKA